MLIICYSRHVKQSGLRYIYKGQICEGYMGRVNCANTAPLACVSVGFTFVYICVNIIMYIFHVLSFVCTYGGGGFFIICRVIEAPPPKHTNNIWEASVIICTAVLLRARVATLYLCVSIFMYIFHVLSFVYG